MNKKGLKPYPSQKEIREAFKKQGTKKGGTKERDEFFTKLEYWCNDNGIIFRKEVKFLKDRKFKFDIAIQHPPIYSRKAINIGLEWEGIMSPISGHLMKGVYSLNCTKYNLAQVNGWIVLRYTVLNYNNAFEDLTKLFNKWAKD